MRKSYFLAFLLAALLVFALPSPSLSQVSVGIAVHVGPPAIPVYEQPLAPGPGYIWTPGYWAYGPDGYFWVPGTWVVAPVGLLWTPGYWGWRGDAFIWHAGYWGPHVGFYGGVNYGFGYGGVGFVGGRWDHGVFAYNTAVSHVDVRVIHNTYVDRTVIVNNNNRVSYNGGHGGLDARPTPEERMAENERHTPPIAMQMQHEHAASANRAFLASENHGRPAVAATARPGHFSGPGVVPSHGAPSGFHPPQNGNNGHPGNMNDHPGNENSHMNSHPSNMNSHPPANENRGEQHMNNAPHNNPHPEERPRNENEHGDKHGDR